MGLRGFEWVEERGWECENPLWGRLAARLFHVLRNLGDALDTVRKSEYARLAGQDRRFIKGQKYTLLAHRANLTLEGKKSLKLLLAANKRLNTAYLLKETFGQLWSYRRKRGPGDSSRTGARRSDGNGSNRSNASPR